MLRSPAPREFRTEDPTGGARCRTHSHFIIIQDPTDDGGGAVPLLLLEAVRSYAPKHMLVEQACYALQAVISGDRACPLYTALFIFHIL